MRFIFKNFVVLLMLFAGGESYSQAAVAYPPAKSKPSSQVTMVWICTGDYAYAYHNNRRCRGLNRCKERIVKVPKQKALDRNYRSKPCGYCYKKRR